MALFLLSVVSIIPFYRTSRYFPEHYLILTGKFPKWLGATLLLSSVWGYVFHWGLAVGVLLSITAIPAAICLLVLLTHLPAPGRVVALLPILAVTILDLFS